MDNVRKLPAPKREPFVTRAELAQLYAISLSAIDREVAAGLPSYKWGNRRRFRLSEVEEYLAAKQAA